MQQPSPCDRQAISINVEASARLWNIETGHCDLVLELGCSANVCQAAFSDGSRFATSCGYRGEDIEVWKRHTGELEHSLEGLGQILKLLFSPNGGQYVASFRALNSGYLAVHV